MNSRVAISSVPRCWSRRSSTSSSRADTTISDRLRHDAASLAALADLLEEAPGDGARKCRFAPHDPAKEADDPVGRLVLEQVTGGAQPDRGEQVAVVLRGREHHHCRLGGRLEHFGSAVKPSTSGIVRSSTTRSG